MDIVLDTNFLLLCTEYKIDYISEFLRLFNKKYSIIIPDQVLDELEDLSDNRVGRERQIVDLALSMLDSKIKKNEVKVKEIRAYDADEAIVELADKSKEVFVATLDIELRKKLKNAKFLTIRQKKYIFVV